MDGADQPCGLHRRDRRLGVRVLPRILRPLSEPLHFDAAAFSDAGQHRTENQDAAVVAPWFSAVADGVGGGPGGGLAAAVLLHQLAAGGLTVDGEDELASAVQHANWQLRMHYEHDPTLRGMATTLTGIVLTPAGRLLVAHSGDSRAYRWSDGILTRQTRDDSLVQALVERGIIAHDDMGSHPHRNVVVASLTGGEHDAVMVQHADTAPGDRWLLCSDGLSDYVPEAEIAAVLGAGGTAREAAHALVALAHDARSLDNVTAVVCDVRAGRPDLAMAPVFSGAAADWTGGTLGAA